MLEAPTAVLLALRRGPAFGREIVRSIRDASGGRVRLGEGSVYPALRRLERAHLVHGWVVVPGRRRGGRARRYYELTERGVRAAEAAVRDLATLLGIRTPLPPTPVAQIERARERLALGAVLSEAALSLRVRRARGSRGGSAA
jgi:DNA-binding PadR family transcriptional regulator